MCKVGHKKNCKRNIGAEELSLVHKSSYAKSKSKIRNSHRMCSIKKVFLKICKFLRKTPVFEETLFNKVVSLRPATLLKGDYNKGVSP